jgi:hypothetical protein
MKILLIFVAVVATCFFCDGTLAGLFFNRHRTACESGACATGACAPGIQTAIPAIPPPVPLAACAPAAACATVATVPQAAPPAVPQVAPPGACAMVSGTALAVPMCTMQAEAAVCGRGAGHRSCRLFSRLAARRAAIREARGCH